MRGSRITAVPRGSGCVLIGTDLAGEVYANTGAPGQTWWGWGSVSQGSTAPGAPVAAVPWDNEIALFLADPKGGVYTAAGDPQTGFGPWASVSQGSTKPGGSVTAIPWSNQIALFLADPNGGVYTAAGDPEAGFGPWISVSQGSTIPGAPITAVSWSNQIALFLADPKGGVYTAAGDPQTGFGPWASVSQGSTKPGGSVTAIPWSNQIALFLADPNGGVYTAAGDPHAGFGGWSSVSQFPPAPAAYQLGVLPSEASPTIPEGDEIILYLHGGPGSRLEEAADLVGPLHAAGISKGKRYTVIAFDQPSQGYSSMLGPDQIVPTHDQVGDRYPAVVFSEDVIAAFVDSLDKVVPIKNRNIYIIGGSLGGALALRMGHRSENWIKRIVAWSAACVWTTYAHDVVKGIALNSGFDRSGRGEDPGRRKEYFDEAFGTTVIPVLVGTIQPNPEEWYRGDRDHYYPDLFLLQPAAKEWPCKCDYIAAARLEQQEVYNWRYRRWHWRLGTELLLFSFFNDSWEGPANTAPAPGDANYWGITKPTLLAAAEDDDWNEGGNEQWENRWSRTWEIAPLMKRTPGYTLFLPNTGHSIHNERPILFAEQIVAFLSDPDWDVAGGPLQVRPLFDQSNLPDEDKNCLEKPSQLSQYPRPPQELLANPDSAAKLMEPARLGGNFSDGSSPGTYGLRLIQVLRDVAVQCNPVVALGTAAAHYYRNDPIWGAFADLAVTGRVAYDAFRQHQPTDDEIKAEARTVLSSTMASPPDEIRLADAVLTAKTRAYKVAWVLRDPDLQEGYRLRPAWGWIAVSGEDDPPARPVNVASGLPIFAADGKTQVSAHPQYELTVQMPQTPSYQSVSFQVRYTIASPPKERLVPPRPPDAGRTTGPSSG